MKNDNDQLKVKHRVAEDAAYLSALDTVYGITASMRYPRPPNVRRTNQCKNYWGFR